MDKKNSTFKGSLDVIKNQKFYNELDESSRTLRHLAGETADFLISLKIKTPLYLSLIKSFQTTQSIAIEKIDEGINDIKKTYNEINLDMAKKNKLPLDEKDFFALVDKQNRFNEEANLLLANAIKLYEAGRTEQA